MGLLRGAVMIAGIVAGQRSLPVCAYPLNDDGTIAAALGFAHAGPAVDDGQLLQYTLTGSGGLKGLFASGALSSARIARDATAPIGFEAISVNSPAGVPPWIGLVLSDSGGAEVNRAYCQITDTGDLVQFEVASDGTVTAKKNGAPYTVNWEFPGGQTTVGATDFFSPYFEFQDGIPGAAGQTISARLITDHQSMTGTYTSGAVDICGNVI